MCIENEICCLQKVDSNGTYVKDIYVSDNLKILRKIGLNFSEVEKIRKMDCNLLDKFNNQYYFYEAFKFNKRQTIFFINYIISRFHFVKGFNRREFNRIKRNIINMITKKISDKNIYYYFISLKNENKEEENYSKITQTKVNKLKSYIGKVNSILDIGTEDIKFLDALQFISDKVRGINIGEGFCHYHFCDKKNDNRFQLYNGTNIPHPNNSFDVITMYSVIHHVSDDDLDILLKDIYRVSKKYVFIKDVDLNKQYKRNLFDIQHILYEDVIYTQGESYRNDYVTFNKTKQKFEENGFKLIKSEFLDNFNGTYYALFEKH